MTIRVEHLKFRGAVVLSLPAVEHKVQTGLKAERQVSKKRDRSHSRETGLSERTHSRVRLSVARRGSSEGFWFCCLTASRTSVEIDLTLTLRSPVGREEQNLSLQRNLEAAMEKQRRQRTRREPQTCPPNCEIPALECERSLQASGNRFEGRPREGEGTTSSDSQARQEVKPTVFHTCKSGSEVQQESRITNCKI